VAKFPQAERLHFIDALRGLAALYVLLFHFVMIPQPKLYVPPAIRPLVLNGWSGVTLFFVISAFTLASPSISASMSPIEHCDFICGVFFESPRFITCGWRSWFIRSGA
jgi:peptidoglycan/LPS O-acetylase OafA/YrhL